jgi:fatty-acyl-CoA synthase
MTADQFRSELTTRLKQYEARVLLHIIQPGESPIALTGGDILRESERLAQNSSSPAGGVVLLLLPHSVELFLLHIGLILTRRVPAILPWPTSRVDPEKYHRNLVHQLHNLPAEELMTTPVTAANLRARLPYRVTACNPEGGLRAGTDLSVAVPPAPTNGGRPDASQPQVRGEALFLQFSGGTTGNQKAVVVTARILTHQLDRLREALHFSGEDVVVSWLPLYHDMGLIGCLWLPLWHAAPSVQFAASEWLLNPGLLLELLERYHGTFCWLPNFAFSYLANQRTRMSRSYSLSHVRGFVNCSEPIRLRSMERFAEVFADGGVTKRQLQSSYAMAENVFAVTQSRLGQQPTTFSRKALAQEGNTTPLAFNLIDDVYVSSGYPLAGMQVRITSSQGIPCRERTAGEIQLSTESLFSGYWGPQGFGITTFTKDGWYPTGDYGFLAGGELYVIGRLKDIVIVGGQNISPEDVESVVNTVPGIYPGRVVAFGTNTAHDTESLIVVAEMKGPYDRDSAVGLEKEIAALVLTSIGLAPGRVCVLPERWIVKSTAGKISRRETRERYLREHAQLFQNPAAVEAIHP